MKTSRIDNALPKFSDYIYAHAKTRPDHPALIYRDKVITYSDLLRESRRYAEYLKGCGLKKGDVVLYSMSGCPDFFCLLTAASMTGIILAGVNIRYTAHEAADLISLVQPRMAVVMKGSVEKNIREALSMAGTDIPLLVYAGTSLVCEGEGLTEPEDAYDINGSYGSEDDGLLIIFTSGSSGKPKAVLLTNRSIICSSLIEMDEFCHGRPEEAVLQHQVPVDHVSGAVEWGASPLIGGCTQILAEGFDAEKILRNTEKYRATVLAGVPAMWTMMTDIGGFDKYDLSSVNYCLVSASAPSESIAKVMKTVTPACCNSLGMTETSGFITYQDASASEEQLYTEVGKPAPEIEMRIDPGSGELQYRGPVLFKEYYHDPEATKAAFTEDGWFRSGDAAELTNDGNIKLLGRLREMFITGGYNVYPAEIESCLSRYPDIASCAVLPMPHRVMSEVAAAFIVVRDGHSLDRGRLSAYLEDHLAGYKIPRTIIELDSMPVSPLGKPLKSKLASMLKTALSK